MAETPSLPTTSFAVLGMLAIQSWTAYELTQQMRRSLDYCWPKTESVLYDEPRRLERLGLATSEVEQQQGRARTRWSITEAGRAALTEWLATPPQPPRLEIETMLRLLFADHGEPEDLRRAVEVLRGWAAERVERGDSMVREYLAGRSPYPERAHLASLFGAFYGELFELVDRWADIVEAELDDWPSTSGVGMTERGRHLLEAALARRVQSANDRPGSGS